MSRACKFLIKFVILNEANDLLSGRCKNVRHNRSFPFDKLRVRMTMRLCELQSRLNPRAWVQKVAQRIADKVEGQNREHYRHRREEHEMRGVEQV